MMNSCAFWRGGGTGAENVPMPGINDQGDGIICTTQFTGCCTLLFVYRFNIATMRLKFFFAEPA